MIPKTEKDWNSAPVFSIELPVNYEDTDAGGVVYYGNYLAYMERVRNACLRELGYPLHILAEQYAICFVVTDARLKYHAPARLDDVIKVTLRIIKQGGASVLFEHVVWRGQTRLVEAEIKLAVVNSRSFRPCRVPDFLNRGFARWSVHAS